MTFLAPFSTDLLQNFRQVLFCALRLLKNTKANSQEVLSVVIDPFIEKQISQKMKHQ